MVIGGTLAAVSEAFALARKAGVDPALCGEALLGGFAASRVLEVHGERILTGELQTGLPRELYAKDLRIASETLAELEAPAPVSAAVHQLVMALVAAGTRRGRLLGGRDGPVQAGGSAMKDPPSTRQPLTVRAGPRRSAAPGVIAPAAELGHAASLLAMLTAVLAVRTIGSDGARATGMGTGCWLGHSCLLI